MLKKKSIHLHLCPVAVLPQTPCASSVPRARRSDAGSAASRGLPGPDPRARHRGNRPPWGRERSGLVEREEGGEEGQDYFLEKQIKEECRLAHVATPCVRVCHAIIVR